MDSTKQAAQSKAAARLADALRSIDTLVPPALEAQTAAAQASVDQSLDMARTCRRSISSGQHKAVQLPDLPDDETTGDLTRKFAALRPT